MSRLSLARKQNRILKKIRDCQTTSPLGNPSILHVCREYDPIDLEEILGVTGVTLWEFSQIADLNHPDIANLSDGSLVNSFESGYGRMAIDALRMYQYGSRNSVCHPVLRAIKDLIQNHPVDAWIRRRLNVSITRLILDRRERDIIRGQKTHQRVFPGSIFGGSEYDKSPDNFDCYERGQSVYKQDIEYAEKKRQHFLDLNLPTMAGEIDKAIRNIEIEMKKNQCHGFNQINIAPFAMTLAKLNGYERVFNAEGNYTLRAPREILPDYSQWTDGNNLYAPRLYPYTVWSDHLPNKIVDVIDFLEEFPELNGKPLFDNYWILVPGVDRNDLEAINMRQDDLVQLHIDLDQKLVDRKNLVPILIGERDGLLYFICYWM